MPALTQAVRLTRGTSDPAGIDMPILGLGTYQAPAGETTRAAVREALLLGYRHVDTARVYGNEKDVAAGIAESGVPRSEIFVTTKLWNSDQGYDQARKAFELSSRKLGGPPDLYLVHWPQERTRQDAWRALCRLLEEKQVRAIGVSNYTVRHLEELLRDSPVVPAVNQVELHPFLYQRELLAFCQARGIQLEGYAPLVKSDAQKLAHPELVRIATAHRKTPAQVLVRWNIEHGVVVIPKSVRRERILENAAVFDFALSPAEVAALDALDEGFRTSWDPTDVP